MIIHIYYITFFSVLSPSHFILAPLNVRPYGAIQICLLLLLLLLLLLNRILLQSQVTFAHYVTPGKLHNAQCNSDILATTAVTYGDIGDVWTNASSFRALKALCRRHDERAPKARSL